MSGVVYRIANRLRPHAVRPWFPPVISVSAAADYVFFAASPQLLLVATVLLRGRRWRIVPWCFAASSALGAVVVTLAVGVLGETVLPGAVGALPDWAARFIESWGVAALLGLCALPLSMRSPVFVVALAGVPAAQVGLAVLTGRLIAYHLLAIAAALAPSRLASIPAVSALIASLGSRSPAPAGSSTAHD